MGNCCKKKKMDLLTYKINQEIMSSRYPKENSKDKNTTKNKNNNNGEKIKNVMILKKNRSGLDSKEPLTSNEGKDNYSDNPKKQNEMPKIDKNQLKEYKDILSSYIKLRNDLEKKCKLKNIYVVNRNKNLELIKLYNDIKERENENIEIEEDKLVDEKLIEFISRINEFDKKMKAMNFDLCKKSIDSGNSNETQIDLLNSYLCKKLDVQGTKKNEVTYVNNEENGEFRYLYFKDKKIIKINVIGRIFFLNEIVEEKINIDKRLSNNPKTNTNINNFRSVNVDTNDRNIKGLIDSSVSKKNDMILSINSNDNNIYKSIGTNEKEVGKDIIDDEKQEEFIKIKVNEDKKKIEEKEKNKSTITNIGDNQSEEKEIILNIVKVLILVKLQNIEIKDRIICYLCCKNIINGLIKVIDNENKDIISIINKFVSNHRLGNCNDFLNNIKNNMEMFENENINLFEDKYNFSNININNYNIGKKEIEYLNNGKVEIPYDFILLRYEILEILLKIYKVKKEENIENIFRKVDILKEDDNITIINIYETNNIFMCQPEEINGIKYFDISFVLFYNTKEIFLNERSSLENFKYDIISYLEEKKVNTNKYSGNFFDENKLLLGYFINLKQSKNEEEIDVKEEMVEAGGKKDLVNEEEIKEEKEKIDEEDGVKKELINEETEEDKDKNEEKEGNKIELDNEENKNEKDEDKNFEEENLDNEIKGGNNKPYKLIGLCSTNSNSFLNSFLQCLYHIPEFTNFFIQDKNFLNLKEETFTKEEKIIINDNIIPNNSLSFKYLEVLYHLYYKKEKNKYIKYYSPKSLLYFLYNENKNIFEKNKENNPKDLYKYFIKRLKMELNEKEKLKNLTQEDQSNLLISSENIEISYKKYLANFQFKNDSIIDKYFAGIKLIDYQCETCKYSGNDFKDFYYLDFSLSNIAKNLDENIKQINLKDCFKYYFTTLIENQNCKICDNLEKTLSISSKKIYLSPKILVLFIGDIKQKGNLFKLDMEININEYLKEQNNGYKLIGMITYFQQKGSSGKYFAYCYDNKEKKFNCIFDESIYEVNDVLKDIETAYRLPYILFYKDINLFN